MYVKVLEVNKCCFCFPLRIGILVFGFINLIFSIVAVACFVIFTELKGTFVNFSLEVITSTVLFSIFGMGVILNILLLIAGCQKDVSMLRLYNYYALATAVAALCPTMILLWREMLTEVGVALFVIAMQGYVIVLVRNVVVKLERKQMNEDEYQQAEFGEDVVVPETETLV